MDIPVVSKVTGGVPIRETNIFAPENWPRAHLKGFGSSPKQHVSGAFAVRFRENLTIARWKGSQRLVEMRRPVSFRMCIPYLEVQDMVGNWLYVRRFITLVRGHITHLSGFVHPGYYPRILSILNL